MLKAKLVQLKTNELTALLNLNRLRFSYVSTVPFMRKRKTVPLIVGSCSFMICTHCICAFVTLGEAVALLGVVMACRRVGWTGGMKRHFFVSSVGLSGDQLIKGTSCGESHKLGAPSGFHLLFFYKCFWVLYSFFWGGGGGWLFVFFLDFREKNSKNKLRKKT